LERVIVAFPHRTAIHDDKYDEIYYPEDIHSNRLIDPEGAVWIVETKEKEMEEILERFESGELLDDYNHRLITVSNRFTKLASTGLYDSGDNEIFEGHIVELQRDYDEDIKVVVFWHDRKGRFMHTYKKGRPSKWMLDEFEIENGDNDAFVLGHALTDPELIPETFSVEQYFNQYGTDS
jgi:hypothetical protein